MNAQDLKVELDTLAAEIRHRQHELEVFGQFQKDKAKLDAEDLRRARELQQRVEDAIAEGDLWRTIFAEWARDLDALRRSFRDFVNKMDAEALRDASERSHADAAVHS
ncbi:MAG: hypothetical protein R3C52_04005 [Hyphomonadaceae bacterium]